MLLSEYWSSRGYGLRGRRFRLRGTRRISVDGLRSNVGGVLSVIDLSSDERPL
jgi:hypothetical protein